MANLLPLYTFFDIMAFHPFHSFGIAGTGALKVSAGDGCYPLIRRHAWQNTDAVGTLEIERAIETAEKRLTDHLGYSPAPHYVSETLAWPASSPSGYRWQSVQLTEGEVRAVGVETLASISTGAAVTYSDVDGDGIDETFTVSAATSVTDASQVAVYFSAADRFAGWGAIADLAPRWRLLPVQVSISGGVVTVRGPKPLCVKPIKYEGIANVGANGLDPTDAANFVTTLDLYQRYTGADGTTVATSQAVLTWETRPCHGWWCCCSGCASSSDPAAVAQAVARVGIRDAGNGVVTPAESAYDSASSTWSSCDLIQCDWPDRVTVRYLAGFPLGSDGQMQEPFRTIVARLAAAELARPICGCEAASAELARWQFDVSRSGGANDEVYGAISADDLSNPLGTRRGHIAAWRFIKQRQRWQGFLA